MPDIADAWHQDMLKALVTLQVQYANLETDMKDMQHELRELRNERREANRWRVPVGISIVTLLVLVISNTLTLVLK